MSHINPYIPTAAETLQGIDKAIESIRSSMDSISWIGKSFGRAFEFKEKDSNGNVKRVPKIYTRNGQYQNVMPSDMQTGQSFIAVRGSEKYVDDTFNKFTPSAKEAKISIIVWGNLKRIDTDKEDYIYTQNLLAEAVSVLKSNPYVREILETYDERAEDVFDGYDVGAQYGAYSNDDAVTQYLMHPYGGFRVDLVICYDEPCLTAIDNTPDENGGSGGSGGTGGGGLAQGGEEATDPAEYETLPMITIPITNASSGSGVFKVAATKDYYIDWGTTVRKYTGSVVNMAAYSFSNTPSGTVKIYLAADEIYLRILATGQTIGEIAGIFPATLETLDVSRIYGVNGYNFTNTGLLPESSGLISAFLNVSSKATTPGMYSLPYNLLPSTLKRISIKHNSFDADALDELIDFCNQQPQMDELAIGTQYPFATPTNTTGLASLDSSGCVLQINDVLEGVNQALARVESVECDKLLSVTAGFDKYYQYDLTDVGNSCISVGVYYGGIIDFGDGDIRYCLPATIVRKQYLNQTNITIKVYRNNDLVDRIYLEGDGGTAKLVSISGDLSDQITPGYLTYVNISNIAIPDLSQLQPIFDFDSYYINWIRLEYCSLTAQQLTDFILWLRSNRAGKMSGGRLMIRQTPNAVVTDDTALTLFDFYSWLTMRDV